MFLIILIIGEIETMVKNEQTGLPSYVKFKQGGEVPLNTFEQWLKSNYNLPAEFGLQLIRKSNIDNLNTQHFQYIQTWNNIPIRDAIVLIHLLFNDNKVYCFNGKLYNKISKLNDVILSDSKALDLALQFVNATKYIWQDTSITQTLKKTTGNQSATYYPKSETVIVPKDNQFYICYKFDIFAEKPLIPRDVFVDASSGEILFWLDKIKEIDIPGTAITKYSGSRSIVADNYLSQYRLRENGRNIITLNMKQGTTYFAAVDFYDDDNYWNNINSSLDEYATDVHWATEMTYDYYLSTFNRLSIDGNGMPIRCYVHYDYEYNNAFWNGQAISIGDGSNDKPFATLDIIAHEITHGVSDYGPNFDYYNESGALSEGFSDIMATCIEFFAKPEQANWTIGENRGSVLRSLANPNSRGLPDTYKGNY